jgi:hypothetical protein
MVSDIHGGLLEHDLCVNIGLYEKTKSYIGSYEHEPWKCHGPSFRVLTEIHESHIPRHFGPINPSFRYFPCPVTLQIADMNRLSNVVERR